MLKDRLTFGALQRVIFALILGVSFWRCSSPTDTATPITSLQRLGGEDAQAITLSHLSLPALSAASEHQLDATIPAAPTLELYLGVEGEVIPGEKVTLQWSFREGDTRSLIKDFSVDLGESTWTRCEIDLTALAGRRGTMVLGGHPVAGDKTRIYWSVPVIYSRAEQARTPVFLISLDTLRADHVSAYGYARETTPHLDQWAKEEAVLFENATTPETWTLPSHMSMFTGLYPQHHAVSPNVPLPADIPSLPELLRGQGYLTAGFTGHTWWLRPEHGFARGMDHYDNAASMLRPFSETVERAKAWIAESKGATPFVFLHAYDLHYKIEDMGYALPYSPGDDAFLHFSKPFLEQQVFQEGAKAGLNAEKLLRKWREHEIEFSEAEKEAIVALYDDSLRMLDQRLAEFFDFLKAQELYENALIIVTSDHGEGLGERGYYDHENVWEEEARVPLLVKLPRGTHGGARVKAQVQLVDLLPTIASVLGIAEVPKTDGLNLIALAESEDAPGHENAFIRNGGVHLAVRTEKWKLHWTPDGENRHALYNLQDDPGETRDEIDKAPMQAKELRKTAQEFFGLTQQGWHIEVLAPLNTPWRAQLMVQVMPVVEEGTFTNKFGNPALLQPWDNGTFELEVGSAVPEHVVIPAPRGTLQVRITSPEGMDFRATGQEILDTSEVSMLLDARNMNYVRPEAADDTVRPRINIWYAGTPLAAAPTATDPSVEEQLNALGYGESGKQPAQ